MDPKHHGSSNGGGKYLQGVWMSRSGGGRVERLTKWSDGQKEQRLGDLDRQEHDSMVRMNLMKLEVRDELAALKRSRRTPKPGQHAGQESNSPDSFRKEGKQHSLSAQYKKGGSVEGGLSPEEDKLSGCIRGQYKHLKDSNSPRLRRSAVVVGTDSKSHKSKGDPMGTSVKSAGHHSKSDEAHGHKPVRKVGRAEPVRVDHGMGGPSGKE